jgi:hypothetical protein
MNVGITIITDSRHAPDRRGFADRSGKRCLGLFSAFLSSEHRRAPSALRLCPRRFRGPGDFAGFSIFAAQSQTGELGSRIRMTAASTIYGLRHAIRSAINHEDRARWMRADFPHGRMSLSQPRRTRPPGRTGTVGLWRNGVRRRAFNLNRNGSKRAALSPRKNGATSGGRNFYSSPMNTNGALCRRCGAGGDFPLRARGDLEEARSPSKGKQSDRQSAL